MSTPRILMFLKAPQPGKVKTRLAAEIGDQAAVSVYRQLVENQLNHLPPHWELVMHFAPADAAPAMRHWLGDRNWVPQGDGDLGDRMAAAVRQAFDDGPGPVFCIGADCPALGPDLLYEAARHLQEDEDVVFGPAADGGYYLLGVQRFEAALFTGIPWSTSETLAVSMAGARAAGMTPHLLAEHFDVDTRADLERAVGRHCFTLKPETVRSCTLSQQIAHGFS